MAWQAPCSRIELSGVLPISAVSSVARRLERNSGPCVAYLPRRHSRPRVPRVPCLLIVDVDYAGMLVALDAEHYVGLGPLAPFANIPSERYCSAPHDRRAHPCPSLPSGEPGPPGDAGIDEECYLVDPASSHILVSKIKSCMLQSKSLNEDPLEGKSGASSRERSAPGVHRSARPFYRRCAPGLNWPGRASGAVTLKKLECSKQAYALDTLA
ncbi:hypothetical protein CMV_007048 [Castanea mollissima]|uniref:Uncharacterized protein n=1 Tax=Castanea mollissima TaxID=60419 RepID=A0A8J4RVR8_9ROSI|nr:hypothetical protein CMV_007048 [Castanea mollissima]